MASTDKSTVSFDNVKAIRQTDKALLCVVDGEQHWFPQSHIDADSEVYKEGDVGTLVVSAWIATEKGLV